MPGRDVAVLVPAAGAGRRMGGVRKPLLELHGRPVLHWAVAPFLEHTAVYEVIVALPPDVVDNPPSWLLQLNVRLVAGGATRADSVHAALAALSDPVRRVIVHDGARPMVQRAWIDACLEICEQGDSAVVGYPAVDTIKEVSENQVQATPDRSTLWQVQTPQAFPRAVIESAYQQRSQGQVPTDDAALVEATGATVRMVLGDTSNIKLTRAHDLPMVEAWLSLGDSDS